MFFDVGLIIMTCVFVIANKGNSCDFPAATWLAVAVGGYLADFILLMASYHLLRAKQQESLKTMGLRYLLLLFLVSWMIYGNVLYYNRGS